MPGSRWKKLVDLDTPQTDADASETWLLEHGDRKSEQFELQVKTSKPIDLLRLKGSSLEEHRAYLTYLNSVAKKLYAKDAPRRILDRCPCCLSDSASATEAARIFDVPYRQCRACSHVFVREQPTSAALNELFQEEDQVSATYTDPKTLEFRLQQVVTPKLEWIESVYRTRYSKAPKRLLDGGAGAGHFVSVAKTRGYDVEGIELSRSSVEFAKNTLNVSLHQCDFLADAISQSPFDIVTLWGVLEYVPEPRQFIRRAREYLNDKSGMLIIETPRFSCLGSEVQKRFPNSVSRHLLPTMHMNLYTETSLFTALYENDFEPVAIWYFGMDAFELFTQLWNASGDNSFLERAASLVNPLQAALDRARLCDDFVVAAVPKSSR